MRIGSRPDGVEADSTFGQREFFETGSWASAGNGGGAEPTQGASL